MDANPRLKLINYQAILEYFSIIYKIRLPSINAAYQKKSDRIVCNVYTLSNLSIVYFINIDFIGTREETKQRLYSQLVILAYETSTKRNRKQLIKHIYSH